MPPRPRSWDSGRRAGADARVAAFTVRRYQATDAARVSVLADALYPEYRDDEPGAWRPAEQFDPRNPSPHQLVAVEPTAGEVVGYGVRLDFTERARSPNTGLVRPA